MTNQVEKAVVLDEDRIVESLKEKLLPLLSASLQRYLSIEQAASYAGLSTKHIRRAVKREELPCSNVGGSKRPTYRIDRQHIDAWMDARRVRQAPKKSERDALVEKYFGKKKTGRATA